MAEELAIQPLANPQIDIAIVDSELNTIPDEAMANLAIMAPPSNPKTTVVPFVLGEYGDILTLYIYS